MARLAAQGVCRRAGRPAATQPGHGVRGAAAPATSGRWAAMSWVTAPAVAGSTPASSANRRHLDRPGAHLAHDPAVAGHVVALAHRVQVHEPRCPRTCRHGHQVCGRPRAVGAVGVGQVVGGGELARPARPAQEGEVLGVVVVVHRRHVEHHAPVGLGQGLVAETRGGHGSGGNGRSCPRRPCCSRGGPARRARRCGCAHRPGPRSKRLVMK